MAHQSTWRIRAVLLTTAVGMYALPCSAKAEANPQPGGEPAFARAQWIAPPAAPPGKASALPIFRKVFNLDKAPEDAVLRIVGLGDYDLRVNGQVVTPTGISQPWSQYEKTLYYRDFKVSSYLTAGENCIGVMLYNSFWNNPHAPKGRYDKAGPQREAKEPLLLCAELTSREPSGKGFPLLGTDATWRVAEGPVAFSHIFAGEDFDARRFREVEGWDRQGFDDRTWADARVAAAPVGSLQPQLWPAVNIVERFQPESVKQAAPGIYLYSFAQNSSAQLRFKVEGGTPGHQVRIRGGEHKNSKNRLFGTYSVFMDLILDGRPLDYQWRSYYLGMQYVEIGGAVPEGQPNPDQLPVIKDMELLHVRADLSSAGSFECSSDLFNRTHRLIDWAIRSNMSHVLTDCPHREKLGWLEVSYLLAPSIAYNYDSQEWFAKILHDIRDAQKPDGMVTTVAPSYPSGRFSGAFDFTVEWGAAAALLPWEHYRFYGDPQVLRDSFDSMKRYTDFVTAQSKDGLAPAGLGDWYDYGHGQGPGPSRYTPQNLSSTATWALCANAVAKGAEVLGLADEAAHYRELHAQIAKDFQRHFMDPSTGSLKNNGSPQCANSMALCADVVPAERRGQLVDEIIADLEARDWQQTPGDVGHVYFIRALAEAGRSDILIKVYSRTGKGSYGGILEKGLTSMPETWDAMMDGYQSLNHCMLGHVVEWFHGYIGGIRPLEPGFRTFLIQPHTKSLDSAKCRYESPHGTIRSDWRKSGGELLMDIAVPSGTTAEVHIPTADAAQVLESGKPVAKADGVRFLRQEEGAAVFRVAPGTYTFTAKRR